MLHNNKTYEISIYIVEDEGTKVKDEPCLARLGLLTLPPNDRNT